MTAETKGIARRERLLLCDLFEERGPLAPTLCVGWTTADLAAHLFVREARPWAAAGAVLQPFAQLTDKTMENAKRSIGYDGLVARLRSGPPSFTKRFDDQLNTVEFFVHHEDVRRAGDSPAEPREDAALDEALYRSIRLGARLLARRLRGVALELKAPGRTPVTARHDGQVVTLEGTPQEIVLYLFGRKDVARVELDGPDAAKATVSSARFGL